MAFNPNWTRIDAGSPGQADTYDIIEGRPPETDLTVPVLYYPQLDPNAPENQLPAITPFGKLVYSFLPTHMKEADVAQNVEDGAWPLLRFIDAYAHIGDNIRATISGMYAGDWTDPSTVPDRAVPWLASVLGVPASQKNVPLAQLRTALVNMVEDGRAPTGTRTELAAAAKQFLIGSKQVLVTSQTAQPRALSTEDLALAAAVGYAGRVAAMWVSPGAPIPLFEHRWTGAAHASPSERYERGKLAGENLAHNPAFQVDLTGWSTDPDVTQSRDTTIKETGLASAKLTPAGTATDWYWLETYRTAPAPGEYVARFRVYAGVARTVRPRVWMYDGGTTVTGPPTTLTAGAWQWIELPFTITDAAHRYRVSIINDTLDPDPTPLYVDRVYVARTGYDVDGYFDGDTPDSPADDLWVDEDNAAVHTWADGWTPYTATVVTTEANAVITTRRAERLRRAHTIVVVVRPDDVPGGDLAAFAEKLRDVGVVPAGHALLIVTATASWDSFEAELAQAGGTWSDYERVTAVWADDEAMGLGDFGGV